MKKYIVYPLNIEKRVKKGNEINVECRTIKVLVREEDVKHFEWMINMKGDIK